MKLKKLQSDLRTISMTPKSITKSIKATMTTLMDTSASSTVWTICIQIDHTLWSQRESKDQNMLKPMSLMRISGGQIAQNLLIHGSKSQRESMDRVKATSRRTSKFHSGILRLSRKMNTIRSLNTADTDTTLVSELTVDHSVGQEVHQVLSVSEEAQEVLKAILDTTIHLSTMLLRSQLSMRRLKKTHTKSLPSLKISELLPTSSRALTRLNLTNLSSANIISSHMMNPVTTSPLMDNSKTKDIKKSTTVLPVMSIVASTDKSTMIKRSTMVPSTVSTVLSTTMDTSARRSNTVQSIVNTVPSTTVLQATSTTADLVTLTVLPEATMDPTVTLTAVTDLNLNSFMSMALDTEAMKADTLSNPVTTRAPTTERKEKSIVY